MTTENLYQMELEDIDFYWIFVFLGLVGISISRFGFIYEDGLDIIVE